MPTLSFDYSPDNPPSVQIKALADMHRPDNPIDLDQLEFTTKLPFAAICSMIDSEYCPAGILKTLSHHLRCQPAYLQRIHTEHRRNVLGITDARALKIARARQDETAARNKQTQDGRMRESRVKDDGPGFGLPDEFIV